MATIHVLWNFLDEWLVQVSPRIIRLLLDLNQAHRQLASYRQVAMHKPTA